MGKQACIKTGSVTMTRRSAGIRKALWTWEGAGRHRRQDDFPCESPEILEKERKNLVEREGLELFGTLS